MELMKKTILFALLSLILFSMSCKKDSDVTDIINLQASMSCKINGSPWSATTRYTIKQGNTFLINGSANLGSELMNITFLGTTPGTYIIDPLNTLVEASASFTNSALVTDSLYTATSGTFILSSVDTTNKKISGSFSFQSTNTLLKIKTISEGVFTNLSYQ